MIKNFSICTDKRGVLRTVLYAGAADFFRLHIILLRHIYLRRTGISIDIVREQLTYLFEFCRGTCNILLRQEIFSQRKPRCNSLRTILYAEPTESLCLGIVFLSHTGFSCQAIALGTIGELLTHLFKKKNGFLIFLLTQKARAQHNEKLGGQSAVLYAESAELFNLLKISHI